MIYATTPASHHRSDLGAFLRRLKSQLNRFVGSRTCVTSVQGITQPLPASEQETLFMLLTSTELSAERCEHIRVANVERLAASEQTMRTALRKLPQDGDWHQKLQFCNRLIARQQRAFHPDTLLRLHLLASMDELLQHFEQFPNQREFFQRICEYGGEFDLIDEALEPESALALQVMYHTLKRLKQALQVCSMLSYREDRATADLALVVADVELTSALIPDLTQPLDPDWIRQKRSQLPLYFEGTIVRDLVNRGYERLPPSVSGEAPVLVHPQGGSVAFVLDDRIYHINLALLTGDSSSFPHSDCPVELIECGVDVRGAKIYGCAYTDRTKRSRQATYDSATARLRLNA